MILQQKIIQITMLAATIMFIIYTGFHFLEQGFNTQAIIMWGTQVSIAICTSAFVTGLVAIVSYKKMKRVYYELLGKDLRRLFDVVDDYLSILELQELYFDEYYLFRKDFLNYILICEKETVSLNKKETKIITEMVDLTYLIPRGMIYYSYQAVKKLEYKYLREQNNKNANQKYFKLLNDELKELNEYLLTLKESDLYNESATWLYKKAGIKEEEMHNIDNYETRYRKDFYSSDDD